MKRKRKLAWAAAVLSLLILLGAFFFINLSLRPVLEGLSKARVESVAAKAMNDAILEILQAQSATDSLLKIYAQDGKVYLLQADSGKLNGLAADCAISAQERIATIGEQGVSIPVGTISGVPLLAGVGPNITMKFTPAGSVQSSFRSEFKSAGINQTLHRIILTLTATVRIILPGDAYIVTVTTEASIAENIIVGDVPNAFTDVNNEEDLLNLIPEG